MAERIERIKACLNGGRRRGDHPAVPLTPAELARSAVSAPRLLHGEAAACWPLVRHAGRLGLPTRIGLEDTLTGPDGQRVSGNADLTRLALAVWTAARP